MSSPPDVDKPQQGDSADWYVDLVSGNGETPPGATVSTESWAAMPDTADPYSGWDPIAGDRRIRRRRRIRWLAVGLVLLAIAATTATAIWLILQADHRVAVEAERYEQTALALRGSLPDAQSALALATQADSTVADLEASRIGTTMVEDQAAQTGAEVAVPLPGQLPFQNRTELDDLEQIRVQLATMAADADSIALRTNEIAEYRIVAAPLAFPRELPRRAGDDRIAELAATFDEIAATNAAVLPQIPNGEPFSAHRAAAAAYIARFEDWQAEYLSALADKDPDAAEELIAEMRRMRRGVRRELEAVLETNRIELDERILELDSQLILTVDVLRALG